MCKSIDIYSCERHLNCGSHRRSAACYCVQAIATISCHSICICTMSGVVNIMPVSSDTTQFQALQRTLHQLGYSYPLGIESAPLVQRLLDDLILTSENYEAVSTVAEESKAAATAAASSVAPLQAENTRLIQANNQVCSERTVGYCIPDNRFILCTYLASCYIASHRNYCCITHTSSFLPTPSFTCR